MNPLSLLPNQINWSLVASCLASDLTSPQEQNTWIQNEKSAMEKRLQLMLDLKLAEFKTNHWHFIQLSKPAGSSVSFQIIFTPVDVVLTLYEESVGTLEMPPDTEWQALQKLAIQYSRAGNYFKLRLIKNRLSELIATKK